MRRAVITAVGLVAPQALDGATFWHLVSEGKSAIKRISRFNADVTGCSIGGEVPDFDCSFIPTYFRPERFARHTLQLFKATEQIRPYLPDSDFGIRMGLATSDCSMIAESACQRTVAGPGGASSSMILQAPPHAAVGALGQFLQASGEVHTVSSACAAGLDAIGLAARDIIENRSNCILAGGTDVALSMSPLVELVQSGLAPRFRNRWPEFANRPFDAFAESGVMADGCGIILIEEIEHAMARGMPILAEIIGYANCTDPDQSKPGSGYARCMRRALKSAEIELFDIDYVSAWAPGHPIIDRAEALAIKEVFAEWTDGLPVTSIKGVIGNPMASAGPFQVIAAIYAFLEGVVPPTANLDIPANGLDLDFVMNESIEINPHIALINAHGVGGTNASVILRSCNK
jgi:3-oxoacyl-[acyl-carrier-protein] synthase II